MVTDRFMISSTRLLDGITVMFHSCGEGIKSAALCANSRRSMMITHESSFILLVVTMIQDVKAWANDVADEPAVSEDALVDVTKSHSERKKLHSDMPGS
jgi:hypothetical protein